MSDHDFAGFPASVPPLSERHRIVAVIERRLSVVEEMEKTIDANLKRAERLRQAILARAVAGKLVPQDPADEPASELLSRVGRLEKNHDRHNRETRLSKGSDDSSFKKIR